MRKFLLVILATFSLDAAVAAPRNADLAGAGAYDAVTINGFTLPLADVALLQEAGVLRYELAAPALFLRSRYNV